MLWRMVKVSVLVVMSSGMLSGCGRDEPRTAAPAPAGSTSPAQGSVRDGEALFKQNCSPCHPDGGNASDPARTLRGSVLRSNHITRPEDIVRIMRHPLSRMLRFDVATVSDGDARAIAEYVLKAFK